MDIYKYVHLYKFTYVSSGQCGGCVGDIWATRGAGRPLGAGRRRPQLGGCQRLGVAAMWPQHAAGGGGGGGRAAGGQRRPCNWQV